MRECNFVRVRRSFYGHYLEQGGPNRGPRRNFLWPAEQFYTIQVLSIAGSSNEIFKQPIPSGDFFFRQYQDFGTKIGKFETGSWNNFEKWPARVKYLDHPDLEHKSVLFRRVRNCGNS